ncbi:uncharacterized protein LOC756072 isoform X2 [Strongylocentrotus purpuratus]|nr:uncharacterized protein LOC756072 isoform X2 [Strongylocentrotus purpuratus]|eukprot:XP_011675072.1 PREDICTED: uncharacterized protein LOC756072 isoform X2 [Strongylocentrotus purpuratus]
MFILTQVLSALATVPGNIAGWFPNTTEEISDTYPVLVTPAGWTFLVWAVIYIWMLIYIIYILTTVCRRNKNGPVYMNPPVVTANFLAVFSLNLAFNIVWLFLFSRREFAWSLADSCMLAFTVYVCLWLNHRNVEKYRDVMETNHKVDLWCNRILIQNGLAVYATWTSIATLINLSIALTYLADVKNLSSSLISLSILTAEVVVYFVVDTFYWDRYLRYTFTVYPTIIWALSGVLSENWDPDSSTSIFNAVLLALGGLCFVIKFVLVVFVRESLDNKPALRSKAKGNEYIFNEEDSDVPSISMTNKKIYDDAVN